MSGRALAGRAPDVEQEKGRVSAAPVHRYWPGKAPEWYKPEQASDDEAEPEPGTSAPAPAVVLKRAEDPRLRRLAERSDDGDDEEDAAERHREIAAAQILRRRRGDAADDDDGEALEGDVARRRPDGDAEAGAAADEEEDEEALEARRAAVRERLRRKAAEAEAELPAEADEEDEEAAEEESEYETDSEEEGFGRALLKPVFVPKAERETIAEREALEREEEEAAAREKARLAQRKQETHQIVVERVALEEAAIRAAALGPKEVGDIDTDDEKDEEAEYEQWKSRELRRIRRDREEREREAAEAEQREALRNMTDAERRAWEAAHPKEHADAPKKKWRFLQKYWHKGAFFQDVPDAADKGAGGDEIFGRDFSAPTGDDKMDKTVLPKVMQVKNFGRRGRTKWTHLTEEDTTEFENPLAPERALQMKAERRMAGTDQVFSKPKTYKT